MYNILNFFSGIVIDRELKSKFKPYASRRILRIDYFTKPVLDQDSGDNVLAPLSLTQFGIFDKLSRYSVVDSTYISASNLISTTIFVFSYLDGDFLYIVEWTSIPASSFTWSYLTTNMQKQFSLISGKEWRQKVFPSQFGNFLCSLKLKPDDVDFIYFLKM